MVFSGPDSTLRLQELPRRVPDPQLVRSNGSDVQRKIRRLLFFSTRRRLMRHAAREPRAATHRSRDHVGRSGRSWAFRISTSHALHAQWRAERAWLSQAQRRDHTRSRVLDW